MTVRLRLAALAGVLVAGAAICVASTGLATSALAGTGPPSGVVAVDANPVDSTDLTGLAYAFPAGTGQLPATATATAAHPAIAGRSSLAGVPAAPLSHVVNGPMAAARPLVAPVPGCNTSNNNCGLPNCQASDASCGLLNCVATAACTMGINGLGKCSPTGVGGVLGCGLGSPGINDCFAGLGCGLGGFGLGGCGLFSFSGCGIDRLSLGGCSGFFGGCGHGSGCGFFGGCGHRSDCGFFGGCGSGSCGDDDRSHHGCGSDFGFGNFGFRDFGFRDFRHFSFSSSDNHGHGSDRH
jgi:hypothetical protein